MSEKTSANITKLEEKVEDSWESFLKAQRTSSQKAITFGRECQKLKTLRKDETGKSDWEKYFKGRFPNISIRTSQRCIRIFSGCNLEEFPYLSLIGQNKLYDLCNLVGKSFSVGKFLNDKHGIDASGKNMDEYGFTKAMHDYFEKRKSEKIQEEDKINGDDGKAKDESVNNNTQNSGSGSKRHSRIPNIKNSVPKMIRNVDSWYKSEELVINTDLEDIKAICELEKKVVALRKKMEGQTANN